MSNPLIAERQDSTKSFSGVQILESVNDLSEGIAKGDWAAIAMGAVGTGLTALSAALDPFGAIFAAGVGWLIEHVEPLSEALDALTGDPDEIKAHADTWKNISAELGDIATDLTALVTNDTAGWAGEAGDAYRQRATDVANLLTAAQSGADGASSGIGTAGEVVAAVRMLVRDIIAELVGHLVSWALQVVFTLGIGLAWVVPQVTAAVAKTATQIANIVKRLVQALKALSPMLRKLAGSFDDVAKALKNIRPSNVTPTPKPKDLSPGTRGIDGPKGGPKGDPTTPSDAGPSPKPDGTPDVTPSPKPDSNGSTTPASTGPQNKPDIPRDTAVPDDGRICKSDPVDIATGEVVMAQTDLELRGVLPLLLRRTHVSSYRAGRWFGPSWASTVDQRLEFDDEDVCYFSPDGMVLVYTLPDPGAVVLPKEGQRLPLTLNQDGTYTVTDHRVGQTLHFGAGDGRILPLHAISNRNGGQRIEIEYDQSGAPTRMRHSGGGEVRIRTEQDRVTQISVHSGVGHVEVFVAGYQYNERGQLTGIVNSSGAPTLFDYDAEGRMTGWQDRNGIWYRYVYDRAGRCVQTVGDAGYLDGVFAYDRERRVTTYTDSLGHTTTFHLNKANQIIRETNPLGHSTAFEWDRYDRLMARTDALGHTTRYEYDQDGNQTAVIYPDGSKATFTYDGVHRPVSIVDPDGAVWRRDYDEHGNLVELVDPTGACTTYTYDVNGALAAEVDPLGNTTRYTNNAAGQPVAVTDPTGARTRYSYDVFGRPATVTDPLGGVTRFQWTVEGKPLQLTHPDGTLQRWGYDAEGNTRQSVDPLGQVTVLDVAHLDLPVARTGPDGTRLQYGYDTQLRPTSTTNEQGLVWHQEYDAAGNLVREQDFNGRVLSYVYDPAGRLVQRTDGAGQTIRMTRDCFGRVVRQECGDEVTTFEYDPVGRLLRARNADADVAWSYDPAGRVLTETVNGRTMSSHYDLAGRRIHRRTPSGADSVWSYDAAGRPATLHTAGRTVRFRYDTAGREVERVVGDKVMVTSAWDVNHQLSSRALITGMSGPAGTKRPGAEQPGRVLQRRSYTYRADGFLTDEQDQLSGPRRFDVDRVGRIAAVHGPGWSERYTYDPAGNITHATWPAPPHIGVLGGREYAGTLIQRAGTAHYGYDSQGRVIRRQRALASGGVETWHYRWGAEDRLAGVVTPDGQRWRYRYDPLGRRIAKQLLDPEGTTVVSQVDFTWDDTQLVEQVHSGGHATVWDWEPDSHRMISQTERMAVRDAPQQWVDQRFYAVVTDLVGTPTELVDADGTLVWNARTTLWGLPLRQHSGGAQTPWRFPGQYFDPETQLHYNFHRYYDPVTGRYLVLDPLGLEAGPQPQAYVRNPTAWVDPLGLMPGACGNKRGLDMDLDNVLPQGSKRRKPESSGNRRSDRLNPGNGSDYNPAGQSSSSSSGGPKLWNETDRPSWDPETRDKVLGKMDKDANGNYICGKCNDGFPAENIGVDHKKPWKDYVNEKADVEVVNGELKTTMDAAKKAYNDMDNLQGLCTSCNSSKGGSKGRYA